jgi:signal transduction histidine kinase
MFNSRITLLFKDKFYENKYCEDRYIHLRRYNIILSLVLTGLCLPITICIILDHNEMVKAFSGQFSAFLCYVSTSINIILTLLCLFIKGNKYQEWLTYLNFLMILFTFGDYKFYFVYILKADFMVYTLLFTVEIMFRLLWFVLGCIDFVPGVYLQVLTMIMNMVIFSGPVPMMLFYRFSIYHCILITTSVLSYFFIRERKRSFYYNLSLKLKNEWYKSIIDNMNSGFISIKNKGIQYYNKTLLNFIKKTNYNEVVMDTSEGSELNMAQVDINNLFQNISSENANVSTFEQVSEMLKKKFDEVGDNFTFIGTKDVEVSNSSFINLEVFGRCYSSNHNKIDRYEFIFNDITRSKQIEQKNAEFKYKTLFLSKIAHEFKNPLLCICELADQVHESLTSDAIENYQNSIADILTQIKSMSNYLIILVKDMDFFSQKSSGTIEKKIQLDKVNLYDILKFCNDIVLALIKKSHKQLNISFQVIKDKYLPSFITTDEIKLKQILINLLSNAIKYTHNGTINFKITLNDGNIKFQVEDTGKGISDYQKEKLFTPFSNESDKLNKVSSGLGLSIVKELLELLGSKIEYESTVSIGSSFWFSLKLDENNLNTSYISDITVPGTHFNEKPIISRLIDSMNLTIKPKFNIIVVDDEAVIRQSTIRLLNKILKEKNINANILEASDGIECLYLYYTHIKDGKSISFILSDETMVYMNGGSTAQGLSSIIRNSNLSHVPFFILSAYENLSFSNDNNAIDGVFTKPLCKQYVEEILKKIF